MSEPKNQQKIILQKFEKTLNVLKGLKQQQYEQFQKNEDQDIKQDQFNFKLKSNSDTISKLISIINESLNDGFIPQEGSKGEYTSYLSFLKQPEQLEQSEFKETLKYVTQLQFATTDKNKSIIWLLLKVNERNIGKLIDHLGQNQKILRYYTEECLIRSNFEKLLKMGKELDALQLKIEGDTINQFKQRNDNVEDERLKRRLQNLNKFNDTIAQEQKEKLQSYTPPNKYSRPTTPNKEEAKDWMPNPNKVNHLLNLFRMEKENENKDKESQITNSADLPLHLLNKKKGKPSKILYEEVYKDIINKQDSRVLKKPTQNLNLEQQNHKCFTCQIPIYSSFFNLNTNCDYCYQTGRYHCIPCMSTERMPLPWKALQEFDLKHYKVSKNSNAEIKKIFDVPLLLVSEELIKQKKDLFSFLVMKRCVHLLYDMICDPKLAQELMEKNINLCLKEHYLSLKQFYEIFNGSLIKLIEGYYEILNKHVDYCKSCQKRGHQCGICKDIRVVHAYDIKHVTYCEKCRHLYHRDCLERQNCPYCVHNM